MNYKISNVSEILSIIYKDLYLTIVFYAAGEYTVVASTFEADLIGKFILTVASSIAVQAEPIPSEGAVS